METFAILFWTVLISVIGVAFGFVLIGLRLNYSNTPKPPEHLRPKIKCICNNIANHSPGGRCAACYKKGSVPRMRNPLIPARKDDFGFSNFPTDEPSP
jgi:hypothetical protein